MPGRKPIDINQQTHDRGNLKGSVKVLPESVYAYRNQGLGQFALTTSEQLATVISDETGTGSIVYNTNPILYTPQIDTVSRIITSEVTTGTTTTNQVLMSFPLYEGTDIATNVIIGSADVIIQTDVGDTTGTSATPEAVTKRRLTKMLVLMDHDWNGDSNPQSPSPDHTEYGQTATTTNICTYNFACTSKSNFYACFLLIRPLLRLFA
jgi:hypothetical protein